MLGAFPSRNRIGGHRADEQATTLPAVILWLSFLALALGVVASPAAYARAEIQETSATYYVATNGSDSNSCTTVSSPCATLNGVRQKVNGACGSTVYFRAGLYQDQSAGFTSSDTSGGCASNPITYTVYPGDSTPVLTAGSKVHLTSSSSGDCAGIQNCYQVTLSLGNNFEGLWINTNDGNGYVRRYRTAPFSAFRKIAAGTVTTTSFPLQTTGDITASFAPNDIEIVHIPSFVTNRMRVSSVNGQGVVTLTGKVYDQVFFDYHIGDPYVVENDHGTFVSAKSPQTWHLTCDASGVNSCVNNPVKPWTLSYIAAAGEDLGTATVIIANRNPTLMTLNGVDGITFSGLELLTAENYVVPEVGLPGKSGQTTVPAAISCTNCSHVTFTNDEIHGSLGWLMEFVTNQKGTPTTNTVTDSALWDAGAGFIRLGKAAGPGDTLENTENNDLIQDNYFYGAQRFFPGGIGALWIGNGSALTINHNTIAATYNGAVGVGVDVSACGGVTPCTCASGGYDCMQNIAVTNNLMYNLGQGVGGEMGCIHYGSGPNTGNTFAGNVCHDVTHNPLSKGSEGAHGIYIDNGAQNIRASDNLIYRVGSLGFADNQTTLTTLSPNTISNNIFAYAKQAGYARSAAPGNSKLFYFSFKHNVYYYDVGPPQEAGGGWDCNNSTPCTQWFALYSNLYYSPTLPVPTFTTTDPSCTSSKCTDGNWNFNSIAGSGWQSTAKGDPGEDIAADGASASVFLNPLFTNPACGVDDYTFTSTANVALIGFADFTSTWQNAGRTTSGFQPPFPPDAFPISSGGCGD